MKAIVEEYIDQREEDRIAALEDKIERLSALVIQCVESNKEVDEVLTLSGVASYLNVTVQTIKTYRKKYGLPSHKVGQNVYFLKSEIARWISERVF